MASKEDMLEVNNGLTMEELDTQMQECEADCDATTWQSSIEEVFAQPDPNRTSFVWQIHLPNTEPYPEEWEAEQDDWFCLPSHWQSILNARLADFRSKVSDAEAFHRSRKDAFGDNDIKTKNALTKLKQLEQGDGSSFDFDQQGHTKRSIPGSLPKINGSSERGVQSSNIKQSDCVCSRCEQNDFGSA